MQESADQGIASSRRLSDPTKMQPPHWLHARHPMGRTFRVIKWRSSRIKKIALRQGREHAASFISVALLHIAFFLAIAWASSSTSQRPISKDLQAELFRDVPQRQADVAPPEVAFPVVAPPEIVIEDDQPNRADAVVSSLLVLPPRPDPSRPNEQPVSPDRGTAPVVVLKILVSPEGAVIDAKIVPPLSRNQSADEAALAWVKANWRFVPAMLGTTPVQYWTTVLVRFSSTG
jgi:TonB family protein